MMPKEQNIPKFWSPDGSVIPVSQLIFDLDNTLYPASSLLADEMHQRMTDFVAKHLGVSFEDALALRQEGFRKHGTTLRWLQREGHLAEPDHFLDYVHPDNLQDFLKPSPNLRTLLESIPLPKAILTNAPHAHALRILRYFDVESCFDQVFDLQWNQYEGKPRRSAYERPLSALGIAANQAVFIDDLPDYLATFVEMGGNCILVDESGRHSINQHGGQRPWTVVQSVFDLPSVIQ
jgi:putative hydrolase of the HAD superfamily